jgi:cation diffusion facilitator CzcD-associated flavoprotein CzcO
VIIKATGFHVTYWPFFPVVGRGGKTLVDEWSGYPHTYKAVMSASFPNFIHVSGRPAIRLGCRGVRVLKRFERLFQRSWARIRRLRRFRSTVSCPRATYLDQS